MSKSIIIIIISKHCWTSRSVEHYPACAASKESVIQFHAEKTDHNSTQSRSSNSMLRKRTIIPPTACSDPWEKCKQLQKNIIFGVFTFQTISSCLRAIIHKWRLNNAYGSCMLPFKKAITSWYKLFSQSLETSWRQSIDTIVKCNYFYHLHVSVWLAATRCDATCVSAQSTVHRRPTLIGCKVY